MLRIRKALLLLALFTLAIGLPQPRLLQENNSTNTTDTNPGTSSQGTCQQTDKSAPINTQNSIYIGQQNLIPNSRCNQLLIPSTYSVVELEISASNIKHLMITDKQITSCSEEQFQDCPVGSTICIRTLNQVEKLTKHKVSVCQDKFYVYTYIECASNTSNGYVIPKLKQDQGCNPIPETIDIRCSTYTSESCGNPNSRICDEECYWVQCSILQDSKNITDYYGQCIPTTQYKPIYQYNACRANYNFSELEKSDAKLVSANPVWCGGEPPNAVVEDVKRTIQTMSSWAIFFIVFPIICFVLFVCWYRVKLFRDKQAPFNPPRLCPEFLFPKPKYQQLSENELGSYNPPDAIQNKRSDLKEPELVVDEDQQLFDSAGDKKKPQPEPTGTSNQKDNEKQ